MTGPSFAPAESPKSVYSGGEILSSTALVQSFALHPKF